MQWCVQLFCNPMDCSPPDSSVHGILQAILEWVAMPSSRGFSWPKERTQSPTLQADSLRYEPPGKLYGHHFLLERLTWLFSLEYFSNVFSKTTDGRLLLQGTLLMDFFFLTKDKIWALKQKLRFWKTCICHCDRDSVPGFTDFHDEADIIEYKCLKHLHNSGNQHYAINKWLMLQNYT